MANLFSHSTQCSICGKRFWAHDIMANSLAKYAKEKSLCLECAKWMQLSEYRPFNLEIIDGVAYKVFPLTEKEPGACLGGKGKLKCIIHADGTSCVSNDIWTIGKVPERFYDLFPRTGWWIKNWYKARLLKGALHCKGKMCYDRYHCFRYDYTQEFDTGPFNIPPKDHIVGSENCKQFINILDIENYPPFNTEDPRLYEIQEIQSQQNSRGYTQHQIRSGKPLGY